MLLDECAMHIYEGLMIAGAGKCHKIELVLVIVGRLYCYGMIGILLLSINMQANLMHTSARYYYLF